MVKREAGTDRLKVFISYSRRDAEAADALVEALGQRGFEVKIDRRDLPFGQKWKDELTEFIRLSDTVVWLVSEASIRSEWVNWELDEVARRAKRLVPVMIGAARRDRLPRQLGDIHILPAEGLFDLVRDLDALVRVLETDFAWLKEGSRLADRAHEWLARERTSGLLLRSAALSAAERWKERRPVKAPTPGQEVLDLLLASRQAATRRQRWWVGASTAVSLAAIGLASFAVIQREEAVKQESVAVAQRREADLQRDAAERQRKLAEERESQAVTARRAEELARHQEEKQRQAAEKSEASARSSLRQAQANISLFRAEKADALFRQNDKTTAMLLALEALPDPNSADPVRREWPEVPEAKRVLLQSLAETTEVVSMFGHTSTVQAVVFDPDGKRLATAALDSSVRIWDATDGTLLRKLTDVGMQSFPSFSPDGTVLLTNDNEGEGGKLWEVATGNLIGRTPFPPSQGYERMPNASGTHAVAKVGQGFVVWSGDIWKGKPQQVPVDRKLLASSSIVTVNNKGTLGLSVVRNSVTIWDARTGTRLRELQGHRGPITAAAFGPDSSTVVSASAIGGGDGDVLLWDARSGGLLAQMRYGSTTKVTDVALSASGKTALLIADGENAMLMDVASGREVATLYHTGLVTATFSPDGYSVLTLSQNRDAIHWDAQTGKRLQELSMAPSSVQSAAFDPAGARIATGAVNGQAKIWTVSKKSAPIVTAPAAIDCRTFVWVPNEPPATSGELPPGESNNQHVETPAEFAEVMRYIDKLEPYSKIQSRSGVRYTDEPGRAEMIGLHRSRSIAATIGHNLQDPAGRGPGILIWNLKTQALIGRISNVNPSRVWGFHISPDGGRIVAYGDEGAAAVFDIDSRRKVFDLVGHSDIVSAGCFSPDGKSIVTAGFDGKAHIWDAASGRSTEALDLKVKGPSYANFTPDGRGVIVGEDTEDSNEKGVSIPVAGKIDSGAADDDMVTRAQVRAPRCLTPLERRQYLLDPEPPAWCAALGKPPYGKAEK